MTTLVWFRLDLRLDDHPALLDAVERGAAVPVFVWSPEEEGRWAPGAASRWWLRRSLASLDASLRARGSRLIVRRGPALKALRELARETGAGRVVWSRRYEPAAIARDAAVKEALRADGLEAESFNSALLVEPWELKTGQGRPYQVFTPFWRACLDRAEPAAPRPAPGRLEAPKSWPESLPVAALGLDPAIPWDAGLRAAWTPGEAPARERLSAWTAGAVGGYDAARDRLGEEGVSRLSPHLHFGELSPRRIWAEVSRRAAGDPAKGPEVYLKEVGWREFAHHLLHHFPRTPEAPLRAEFGAFPWRSDAKGLRAWTKGLTGYPVVDAGLRQLWATGWLHNRARMICASFLVKDLLVDWREGASWFWDTLVDADLASNTLGWQWTAGCGADAAPFFRIFNPVLQGKKFDPDGAYVRRWVPELAGLPAETIHEPWKAGGVPGYPAPVVDHAEARERALSALGAITKKR